MSSKKIGWIAIGFKQGSAPTSWVYLFREHMEAQWFVDKVATYKADHPDNEDTQDLEFFIYPCEYDSGCTAFANFRDIIEEIIT